MDEKELKERISELLPEWVPARGRVVDVVHSMFLLFGEYNAAVSVLGASTVIVEDPKEPTKTPKETK